MLDRLSGHSWTFLLSGSISSILVISCSAIRLLRFDHCIILLLLLYFSCLLCNASRFALFLCCYYKHMCIPFYKVFGMLYLSLGCIASSLSTSMRYSKVCVHSTCPCLTCAILLCMLLLFDRREEFNRQCHALSMI